MKAEYKRDLQNNYLILEAEEDREEYGLIMARENHIKGLLPMHCSRRDGKLFLYYEITSKQTIESLYETKSMRCRDIWALLTGIRDAMEDMQQYLLSPEQLLFAPDMIYALPERGGIFLCYYPEAGACPITELAEFLLKRLDHEDSRAVSLGYGFYQRAAAGNFGLSETLKEILSTAGREQAAEQNVQSIPAFETVAEQRTADPAPRENPDPPVSSSADKNGETSAEEEESPVVRRERKSKEQKSGGGLFGILHPAVLISSLFLMAVLGVLYYLKILGLRQTGGCFFLLLALEMLLNSLLLRRSKPKTQDWAEEEDTEEYQRLLQEMYQEETVEEKEVEEIKDTCCLLPDEAQAPLGLNYAGADREALFPPRIVPGTEPLLVGKLETEADVVLSAQTVSRVHARIELRRDVCYVKDLNSKNGTYVNGRRLQPQEECEICGGDTVAFADIEYRAHDC